MRVRDVMTTGVECIRPDASLREAAQKMKSMNVGPLPICENDRLVGIVTDRDIVVRAVAEGRDPNQTKAKDVMTAGVTCVHEDDDVEQAAELMKLHQIRRLVVLDRNKRLVGIVSLGDLAVDAGDETLAGNALEAISEPAQPQR